MGGGKGEKALKKVVAAAVATATTAEEPLHQKPAATPRKSAKNQGKPAKSAAITSPKLPESATPFAALVAALVALVATHKATATQGLARALLTALEALAVRSERLLADLASKPSRGARIVPVAHVDGPVIGLSFWAVDTIFDANPIPEERDPKLARLAGDLDTVLSHHEEETMSPAVEAVLSAVWSVLGMVRTHNSRPGTTIQFVSDNTGSNDEMSVRLVDPSRRKPIKLSPSHVELVDHVKDALEHLIDAQADLGRLRDELDAIDADLLTPLAERTATVECSYALEIMTGAVQALRVVDTALVKTARVLHGSSDYDNAPHALHLLSLLQAWNSEDRGWREYTLAMAAGSFERVS